MIKKHYYSVNMVLLILSTLLFFVNLSSSPLERWDEITNKNVVMDFASRPNWVLTLNGAPFFEKPPLWYYLTGMLVRYLPEDTFGLRFISAFSGWILSLTLLLIIRDKKHSQLAVASTLFFLSIGQVIRTNPGGYFSTHHFRSADVDGLQLLLLFWGVYISLLGKSTYKAPIVSGIFFGLAVLTKGPVSLLMLGIIICFQLVTKQSVHRVLLTVLSCIIVALPWYVAMIVFFGTSFWSSHFTYHIFQRTSFALEGHQHPWWFYISVLTNHNVFSLGFILSLIIPYAFYQWKKIPILIKFSAVFILIHLGVFTVIQTKLAWYILPIYPFVSLLLGWFITDFSTRYRNNTKLSYVVIGTIAVLCVYGIWHNLVAIL